METLVTGGAEIPAVHVDPRAGDVLHGSADLSAAAVAFGHRPSVDPREGLARTVAYVAEVAPDGVAATGHP